MSEWHDPILIDDLSAPPASARPDQLQTLRAELYQLRVDVARRCRLVLLSIVALLVALLVMGAVAFKALGVIERDSSKVIDALASMRATEQALTGMTEATAQEILKNKMLREIRTRAASVAAQPEADNHAE